MPKGKSLRMPAVSTGTKNRSRVADAAADPQVIPAAIPPAGAPATAIAPAVVDPQLQKNYISLVDSVVKNYRSATTTQLEFNHDLGVAAAALEAETGRNVYGEATVDQFIKDLSERTGKEVAKSSVYAAKRFAACFNKDDIANLVSNNWSYRNALFLVAEAVPDKLRKELVREVANKELDQKDVKKRLSAEVKPKATRGRKPVKAAPELKRVFSSASQFLSRLTGFEKVLTLLPKIKEDEKKTVKAAMTDTLKGLKELRKQVDTQIKAAEKIKI